MGLRAWLGNRSNTGVALFVDGPNMFRDEFAVDMTDLRATAAQHGQLVRATVFLDEHASPGLIRAAEANGFAVTVTSGDVDVTLAVAATASVIEDGIDVVAIASRDTDFKPVVEWVRRQGLSTVAIAPGEHGRSDALAAAVDTAEVLD